MVVRKDDVLQMVRIQLGKPSVREGDRLMEDLAAESADIENLVAAAEARYHIRLPEIDIAALRTVADLHSLVARFAE
jgi:acyl carrier protein